MEIKLNERILIHSILKQLEWSRWRESYQTCPVCGEAFKYGHKIDCDLNKSIEILVVEKK